VQEQAHAHDAVGEAALARPKGPETAAVVLGTLDIAAVPAEVAPARHWLSKLLADDYAPILDDVVLMACEAITNSVCHSDSGGTGEDGEPGTVTLVVLKTGDMVRVEVIDAGSQSSVPRVIDERPDAVNGRGLHLLDVLSGGRWGSYADAGGRTVWFEIAVDDRG
jgi:anti-sigma regulatory factor (Ser/Thr protein kinase)